MEQQEETQSILRDRVALKLGQSILSNIEASEVMKELRYKVHQLEAENKALKEKEELVDA